MISDKVEVDAIHNMGAAEVGIQLEGALKLARGGSPVPVDCVRVREYCMHFRLAVVNGQDPFGIGLRLWDGFAEGNVSVGRDDQVILCQSEVNQRIVGILLDGWPKIIPPLFLVSSVRLSQ